MNLKVNLKSLLLVYKSVKYFLRTFFTTDLQIISDEVREILSNPEDTKKYKNALNEMKIDNKPKTIILSNNKEITLIP